MAGKIYRGGIPYDADIHRLNAAFNPQPGDLITHEQIVAVLNEPKGSHRYQGLLSAWIRNRNKSGIPLTGEGRARGVGVMYPLASEMSDLTRGRIKTIKKKAVRTAAAIDMTDLSKLETTEEKNQWNLTRRVAHTIAADVSSGQKMLKAPPAAAADGVRTSAPAPSASAPAMAPPPAVGAPR